MGSGTRNTSRRRSPSTAGAGSLPTRNPVEPKGKGPSLARWPFCRNAWTNGNRLPPAEAPPHGQGGDPRAQQEERARLGHMLLGWNHKLPPDYGKYLGPIVETVQGQLGIEGIVARAQKVYQVKRDPVRVVQAKRILGDERDLLVDVRALVELKITFSVATRQRAVKKGGGDPFAFGSAYRIIS